MTRTRSLRTVLYALECFVVFGVLVLGLICWGLP